MSTERANAPQRRDVTGSAARNAEAPLPGRQIAMGDATDSRCEVGLTHTRAMAGEYSMLKACGEVDTNPAHPRRPSDRLHSNGKRTRETQARPRSVRLKWIARQRKGELDCANERFSRLVLESFEAVNGSESLLAADTGEPTAQACVAAVALLTSLLQVPSSTVITADVPIVAAYSNVLKPLSAATVNA